MLDNTQNMAAVMNNVSSDIDLIKNIREKDTDSEIMEVEPSQESCLQSSILPSIAASTYNPISKVIKEEEKVLDKEKSIIGINLVSQKPAFVEGKDDHEIMDKVSSKLSVTSEKKIKIPSGCNSVIEDSSDEELDTEPEDETENMSHSSAYSSQSEGISTQGREKMEEEVAMLK